MTAGLPRLRVLVVENELLLRLVVEEMLVDLGHEIVGWAASAQGAIAEAERTRPDIVLMDIQLDGGGDGIEAAREIRNQLGTPSVFMTGCTDVETHKRALLTRPLAYLAKPLSFTDLEEALRRFPRKIVPHFAAAHQPRTRGAVEGIGQLLSMSGDTILRMSGKKPSESLE